MPKKLPSINYTNRDFNSIRDDLMEYAKRYYPDTYKDFSQPSFGALMVDTVAYVGDVLSFYVDYQANESFLSTAIEYNNVLRLAKQYGYKFSPSASSSGVLTLFIMIPVKASTTAPDRDFLPVVRRGSKFISNSNNIFTLVEDVDFSKTNNEIVVAQVDSTSGAPTAYAVKAYGQVISGEFAVQDISVGSYEKFRRLKLSANNIAEVISVVDSKGNRYYEVDYLSQNIIYVPSANTDSNKEAVPNVIKPVVVARRFILDQDSTGTYLQFGFGSEENPVRLKDPTEVILELHGKDYETDKSFDPSILNETDKLGVAPSNTILTVVYRFNTTRNVNAAARTITRAHEASLRFETQETLSLSKKQFVQNSLEAFNEEAIMGDVSLPSSTEIKHRAMGSYAAQNRAVTKQDYIAMVYRLPSKYGSVKRAALVQDNDSFNERNLNLYVVSEDISSGILTKTPSTLKNNIKTWIEQYKMINDTVDILDAKIVNIGVNFVATPMPGSSKSDMIASAVRAITAYYRRGFDIGEPVLMTDIWSILKNIPSILDVISVDISVREGAGYSNLGFNVLDAKSADGRMITAPNDTIFEIRFPSRDIVGTSK
tara:strand:+ start:7295 stop:9088 length:1794 start_codon:yes stop_codon:yes gene_type:complete